jgi:hypothetical protein
MRRRPLPFHVFPFCRPVPAPRRARSSGAAATAPCSARAARGGAQRPGRSPRPPELAPPPSRQASLRQGPAAGGFRKRFSMFQPHPLHRKRSTPKEAVAPFLPYLYRNPPQGPLPRGAALAPARRCARFSDTLNPGVARTAESRLTPPRQAAQLHSARVCANASPPSPERARPPNTLSRGAARPTVTTKTRRKNKKRRRRRRSQRSAPSGAKMGF